MSAAATHVTVYVIGIKGAVHPSSGTTHDTGG